MKGMKKIRSLLILASSALVFSSCGSPRTINGKWEFDDGSTITFNMKKGSYTAKGKTNSSTGNFVFMNGGFLTTTGTNNIPEQYRIQLTEDGFDIDFKDNYISFKGKKVSELEKLSGKYSGKIGQSEMIFDFIKPTSTLNVSISSGDETTTESFSYETENADLIYFTSGIYATGDPYRLEYIDSKNISIDGSVLKRR